MAASPPSEGGVAVSIAVAAAAALAAGIAIGQRVRPGGASATMARRPADGGETSDDTRCPPNHASKDSAPYAAALEPGRGRQARSPGDFPARGWRDIIWRTIVQVMEDRLMAVSAGVAFFVLLSIFPAIAALVSLYGLFADATTISGHLQTLSFFLPISAVEIIRDQAARIASKSSGTLGTTFLVSVSIALWSANAGMKAMFDALNVVYGEREKRSIVRLNLEAFGFTFGAIAFLIAAISALVVLPASLQFVGVTTSTERIVNLARWPVLILALVAALALLYRFAPSRREARWHWVTWGGIVGGAGWLVTSLAFSWYLGGVATYTETYGSLGAVIGFMTWIWASVFVILVGGELNAEMERQTVHDTTVGGDKPLGRRGAVVADTIGPAVRW